MVMVSGGAGSKYQSAAQIAKQAERSIGPSVAARSRQETAVNRAGSRMRRNLLNVFGVINKLFRIGGAQPC